MPALFGLSGQTFAHAVYGVVAAPITCRLSPIQYSRDPPADAPCSLGLREPDGRQHTQHVGSLDLVNSLVAHYREDVSRQRVSPCRSVFFIFPALRDVALSCWLQLRQMLERLWLCALLRWDRHPLAPADGIRAPLRGLPLRKLRANRRGRCRDGCLALQFEVPNVLHPKGRPPDTIRCRLHIGQGLQGCLSGPGSGPFGGASCGGYTTFHTTKRLDLVSC